jgi:hypothetical protein
LTAQAQSVILIWFVDKLIGIVKRDARRAKRSVKLSLLQGKKQGKTKKARPCPSHLLEKAE